MDRKRVSVNLITNSPAFNATSEAEPSANTKGNNKRGKTGNKHLIIFISQSLILYIVIIVCLVNLTIGRTDNSNLWTALLSSSIGYILPNPKYKKYIEGTSSTPLLIDSGNASPAPDSVNDNHGRR